MKLCLRCRGLYPHEASFCARCCRPLGFGSRCEHGHFTPGRNLHCCAICGSTEVSAGVPFLNLRWLSRSLSWILVIGFLRLIFGASDLLQSIGTKLLGLVAGERLICQLLAFLHLFLRGLMLIWVAQLLFGRKPVELVPSPKWLWHLGGRLFALIRALAHVVEGTSPAKPKKKRKKDGM